MKLIPNYYTLFGIEEYSELSLSDNELYDRLLAVINNTKSNLETILAHFETGHYVLNDKYIKQRYDYVLLYGSRTIITNPLKVMYMFYIITIVNIRIRLSWMKE